MAGLIRQASGRDFATAPIAEGEWKELAPTFKAEVLSKSVDLTVERAPELARPLLQTRLRSVVEDVRFFFLNSPGKAPDKRFFKGVSLK